MARLQSGQLKVDPKPLDLARIVQEAIESFEEPAKAAGLRLTHECMGDLRIKADPSRLSQVLYNLLSNAIKFTPAGGHVNVRAGSIGSGVEVQVIDDGRGLEPAEMARLFQPFSQVPEATSAHKGTGLGLYISRGIVTEHGGTLQVESHGHGKGSTFRMRLPVEPPVRRKASPPMDG